MDNEDDNKTHRPVAPKDASLQIIFYIHNVALSNLFLAIKFQKTTGVSLFLFCFVFCFAFLNTGSEEASSLSWQPGGNYKRRTISTCKEG